jgi:hypothetical protein|tara:strand:- start:1243 stop:1404 length:162 start_codon:yes stop_codon:yes gene_type:complete
MSKIVIVIAFTVMICLSLWLLDRKLELEALDYQECNGRYCELLDPPPTPAYKR